MCGEGNYIARLSALGTGAFFWGLYTSLFLGCCQVLVHRRGKRRLFLPISIVIFMLCSSLFILDFARVLLAPDVVANSTCVAHFCGPCDTATADHMSQVLVDSLIDLIQQAVFATNQFLADGLLIFRCYVLWKEKKWIVTLPILLLLASTACSGAALYGDIAQWSMRRTTPFAVTGAPDDFLSINALYNRIYIISAILSLFTTIVTTVLVASRIWIVTHELEKVVGRQAGSRYRKSMALIIESGAMYSISLIVVLVVWSCALLYVEVPRAAMRQIMGIAPTLIIVRIGLRLDVESCLQQQSAGGVVAALPPVPGSQWNGSQPHCGMHWESSAILQATCISNERPIEL